MKTDLHNNTITIDNITSDTRITASFEDMLHVSEIFDDPPDSTATYYNLNGVPVENPDPGVPVVVGQ